MSPQATDPLLGVRFGSYVVEKLLGQGGMGAVYAAVQPEIGKRVAIKFLAPELVSDPQLVQRFFAEARAVNLIQHENIVDIFDFKSVGGYSYFVMELLAGESLGARLERVGSMAPRKALAITVQVAAAIAAAHAHQIVHRDLKPDNIFLTTKAGYEDFVKVLDFGIAKLSRDGGSQTLHGTVMGTPGFMAPEQASGGSVDARADLYALGVILYRALSGRMPFEGQSFDSILIAQLKGKVRPLTDVPPALGELVLQLLEREPERRPPHMRAVQERLVAALRPLEGGRSSGRLKPVSAGWRSVPPTRISQEAMAVGRSAALAQVRRQRLQRAIAVASLALAAGAGGFWLTRARRASGPEPEPAVAPAPRLEAQRAPQLAGQRPAVAVESAFPLLVETVPSGAEVWADGQKLGATPASLLLARATTLRLRLSGYREEELPVAASTEHAIVKLHPAAAHARPSRPRPPSAIPARDSAGVGLND